MATCSSTPWFWQTIIKKPGFDKVKHLTIRFKRLIWCFVTCSHTRGHNSGKQCRARLGVCIVCKEQSEAATHSQAISWEVGRVSYCTALFCCCCQLPIRGELHPKVLIRPWNPNKVSPGSTVCSLNLLAYCYVNWLLTGMNYFVSAQCEQFLQRENQSITRIVGQPNSQVVNHFKITYLPPWNLSAVFSKLQLQRFIADNLL